MELPLAGIPDPMEAWCRWWRAPSAREGSRDYGLGPQPRATPVEMAPSPKNYPLGIHIKAVVACGVCDSAAPLRTRITKSPTVPEQPITSNLQRDSPETDPKDPTWATSRLSVSHGAMACGLGASTCLSIGPACLSPKGEMLGSESVPNAEPSVLPAENPFSCSMRPGPPCPYYWMRNEGIPG